jgi:hypothetical protein
MDLCQNHSVGNGIRYGRNRAAFFFRRGFKTSRSKTWQRKIIIQWQDMIRLLDLDEEFSGLE